MPESGLIRNYLTALSAQLPAPVADHQPRLDLAGSRRGPRALRCSGLPGPSARS
jgi:hypothetical protein